MRRQADQAIPAKANTRAVGLMFETLGMGQIAAQVPIPFTIIIGPMKLNGYAELNRWKSRRPILKLIAKIESQPRSVPSGTVCAVEFT